MRDPDADDPDAPAPAALQRLLAIAQSDTGPARRVANLWLAWWNAPACGGFDPAELWAVEDPTRADMLAVLQRITDHRDLPDAYGVGETFEHLVQRWRPGLVQAHR